MEQWEKSLLEVKGGESKRPRVKPRGGLINVLEPK